MLGLAGLGILLWQPLLIWALLGTGWLLDDEIPAGARLWLSERVLGLSPQSVQALKLKAEACEQKGDNGCAWQTWESLLPLQVQPEEQAWIHLQLGRLTRMIPKGQINPVLTTSGQWVSSPTQSLLPNTEARLAHLNQALKLNPELEEAWFVRGLLKTRENGDCLGAKTDLERACKLGYTPPYGPVQLEICENYTYPSNC